MKRIRNYVLISGLLLMSACGGSSDEDVQEIDVTAPPHSENASPEPPPSGNDEAILPAVPVTPASSVPSEEPAAAPEAAAPLSLHVEAEKTFGVRLGLVKLSWNVAGPIEEIYLWSKGFNRQASDASNEDPCGAIENSGVTRHLLVNSVDSPNLGYDLNEGSPAHEALRPYLDSARLCDESLCEDFTEGGDTTPACRIDLDPQSSTGSFYTRTLTRDAVYRLCVKTAEGTTCEAAGPVTVPQVSFEETSAAVSSQGRIRMTLDYGNAVREVSPPAGCVKLDGLSRYNDRDMGRGTLAVECPIDKPQSVIARSAGASPSFRWAAEHRIAPIADIAFHAQGLGAGNTDARAYKVEKASPVVSLGPGSAVACDDSILTEAHCSGRIDLIAETTREFDLFEIKAGGVDEKILHGKVSAGLPIALSSNRGPAPFDSVLPESETEMRFKGVRRSHADYRWRAAVEENGATYRSGWFDQPKFPAQFKLLSAMQTLHPSNWDTCEYEDTDDGESECGACVETSGFYQASVGWEGRHLKHIGVYCTSANEGVVAVVNPVTIPDTYEKQGNLLGGPALAFQVPVNRSNWTDELVCVLTGDAYDGTKILQIQTWKADCRYTHAVAGDPLDPDLEGAFIENGTGWANAADLWTLVSSQWDGE